MTNIRWTILILTLSIFLSGCAMAENPPAAPPATEPAHTPIPVETKPTDVEPTRTPSLLEEEPPSLYMLQGDIAFPMDRGSYCWTISDEGGICVDVAVFPIFYAEDEYTPVIGNTLELLFDAPFPAAITASLYPDPSLKIGASDVMVEADIDENGRILVTVPDDVNGHYALLVFATWEGDAIPNGDASYSTPVRFGQ